MISAVRPLRKPRAGWSPSSDLASRVSGSPCPSPPVGGRPERSGRRAIGSCTTVVDVIRQFGYLCDRISRRGLQADQRRLVECLTKPATANSLIPNALGERDDSIVPSVS